MYHVTLLTTVLGNIPVVFDLHSGSNDQWDFLRFIIYLVHNNHLTAGNYLFLDNAAVHWGEDTWPIVQAIMQRKYKTRQFYQDLTFLLVQKQELTSTFSLNTPLSSILASLSLRSSKITCTCGTDQAIFGSKLSVHFKKLSNNKS